MQPRSRTEFGVETAGLPEADAPMLVRIRNGESYAIEIGPVRKRIGGADVRMLGYNGSIPGPTLHVDQGSKITVVASSRAEIETTLHWHGLRLENRFDGVPGETQDAIPSGGAFTYRLRFPDPGFYWYHPHVREDFAQEMGLYGGIIVEPGDPGYWPAADRQLTLTLDDVLIEDGRMAPFDRSGPTFTAMGRFGNVMLVNGEPAYTFAAAAGEVVRLHLVNTANTRLFNFAVAGAEMKLIGGDSGRVEREQMVDSVLLSPSERAIVDVLFAEEGEYPLENRTPGRTYELGRAAVSGAVESDAGRSFAELRSDAGLTAERERLVADLAREPDEILAFTSRMVMDHESAHDGHGTEHAHDTGDGLEWEDLMPAMNRGSTMANMIWELRDERTRAVNDEIDWTFRVGDRIKVRLVNGMDQDHPMHHPFHIHGAGRFLVLSRDGAAERNLAWKDTVLVRSGETVDLVLEVTNPGRWMAHCHIAEHTESNMMLSFDVVPASAGTGGSLEVGGSGEGGIRS
jgi:FtsP/CotA-like multicopper oxidase with cupredoxin domain